MRRAAVIFLMVLVALTGMFIADRLREDWKGPLEQAVRGADRLVIAPTIPSSGKHQPAVLELRGAAKVAELMQLIEIDAWRSRERCECFGDTAFRFHRGDELLATVALAHGHLLKWNDGPWRSDARLTKESKAALSRWLKQNGYAGSKKAANENPAG